MNNQKEINNPNKQNATINKNLKKPSDQDGLDQWNERLDHNLENEHEGDPSVDDNAKTYSDEHGSGDQSDSNN